MDKHEFTLSFGVDDSDRWHQLLSEINDENVIPVIGVDMLTAPKQTGPEESEMNFHQQLISFIAVQTGVKSAPKTFSQLVFDINYQETVRYKKEQIYKLINQILSNLEVIREIDATPSAMLMDLLGTKKFPFVITTSFSPVVENAMKQIWGNVRVLRFNNNPQTSMQENIGDIRNSDDMKIPTVFYMFGKFSNTPYSYVVTDMDMMNFCCSWMARDGIPKRLTEELKKKYLLVLGNNYSDWLFRFIWYGLRSNIDMMKTDVIVGDKIDPSLVKFLEYLETFTQTDPAKVIQTIKSGLAKFPEKNLTEERYDVFISYSRSDTDIAVNLCNSLKSRNLRVWFDDKSIPKGHDWKPEMISGVRNSMLFVPILSRNIENESLVPHEYRAEWSEASDITMKLGGRVFIIPFADKAFDFYNPLTKLPAPFLEKNAVRYKNADDMNEITKTVLHELDQLKQLQDRLNYGKYE